MAKTVEQMWKELKARGWEIDQTVNRDGDACTVLRDPTGHGVDVVDYKWVTWKAFKDAITAAWKAKH
jgi:hypothetical protein